MNDNVKRKGISIKKIFLLVCLILFLIMIYSNLFSSFNSVEDWKFFFFTEVPFFSLMFLGFLSPLWIGSVAIKSADKKVKEESMSKIDFVNSREYYRDILKRYGSIELSYIDDFDIDYPRDIIATLLSLKLKKKITISNNFIEILDFSDDGLKESEKYILKSIKEGKVKIKNSYDIKQSVERALLEEGLIMKISDDSFDNSVKKNFKSGFRVHIGIIALFVIFFLFGETFINLIINNYTISNEIYSWLMTFSIPALFFYFCLVAPAFWSTKNSSYSAFKKNLIKELKMVKKLMKKLKV